MKIDIPTAYIPEGTFIMGDYLGDSEEMDTKPAHEVYLNAFKIALTPTTNSQYRAFVDDTGYVTIPEKQRQKSWKDFAMQTSEDHPVSAVNWIDANAFCQWAGGRLPTEAEWEKAAQGDLDSPIYPWGNEPPANQCNWREVRHIRAKAALNGMGGTTPVMSFPANGYGLHDMSGNVWEWVADVYQVSYYQSSPRENPQGPDKDDYGHAALLDNGQPNPRCFRVARGGGFENVNFGLRCCERISASAGTTSKAAMSSFRMAG